MYRLFVVEVLLLVADRNESQHAKRKYFADYLKRTLMNWRKAKCKESTKPHLTQRVVDVYLVLVAVVLEENRVLFAE